jgi:hypothetical protein
MNKEPKREKLLAYEKTYEIVYMMEILHSFKKRRKSCYL